MQCSRTAVGLWPTQATRQVHAWSSCSGESSHPVGNATSGGEGEGGGGEGGGDSVGDGGKHHRLQSRAPAEGSPISSHPAAAPPGTVPQLSQNPVEPSS